jgi:hypothetical protein
MIDAHLVKEIGPKNILLRSVPHRLTSKLLQKRVKLSGQLPSVLEQQLSIAFSDIVTGDELWFLQHCNHRQI